MDALLEIKVSAALNAASDVLTSNKEPVMLGDVPHDYEDKFEMAEFIVKSAREATLSIFKTIGVTEDQMKIANEWSANDRVTIEFKSEEFCDLNKQTEREESSPTDEVSAAGILTVKSKVVTKIQEWHWVIRNRYKIILYPGNKHNQSITIVHNEIRTDAITLTDTPPIPTQDSAMCDLHWFFNNKNFQINRSSPDCHTPLRNTDTTTAGEFFLKIEQFYSSICKRFRNWCSKFNIKGIFKEDDVYDSGSVFLPVQSFLIRDNETNEVRAPQETDLQSLIRLQDETLNEKIEKICVQFKVDTPALTSQEAQLLMVVSFGQRVCKSFVDAIGYIESLLYSQLRKAIGCEISDRDFDDFMKYHSAKLVLPEYKPRQLSYPVRSKQSQNPAGNMILSRKWSTGMSSPVLSICKSKTNITPTIETSSGCIVEAPGDVKVHSIINNMFKSGNLNLELKISSKRFNGIIAVLGTIEEGCRLKPCHAITLVDSDSVTIPFIQEMISSGNKNVNLESLSEEQRQFALAYKNIQLANSLFGVLLVPLIPNLEKLVNLPEDSLLSEVQLVTDLVEIFSKFQVSGDLIAFCEEDLPTDLPDDITVDRKILFVRQNVDMLNRYIEHLKKEELREATTANIIDSNNQLTSKDVDAPSVTTASQTTTSGSEMLLNSDQLLGIPYLLDGRLKLQREGGSICQSILKPSPWTSTSKQSECKTEALSLLEIFTNTGAVPLHHSCQMHVIVSVCHLFEDSLVDTLIRKSNNPIENIEKTILSCASVIHETDISNLLAEGQAERLMKISPSVLT